jgi:2,5-diketo-D-gluconate reductase A
MTSASPDVTLNDGRAMPRLGLGVFRLDDAGAASAVGAALGCGYRSIDTAAAYGNEAGVGQAIRASGLPRDEIFVTTKVWNDDQGFDRTLRAFEESLARLGLEAVDLYLIHWPAPRQGRYLDTWKALVRLREEGRARSIGVSNFREPDLRRIVDATGVVPAVNQVELHPRFQQRRLRALHAELGIATEAWSPLGKGRHLDDPGLRAVAARHGRTPAQVVLAWHLARGIVAIPKSAAPSRIAENFAALDLTLEPEDLAAIDALDAADGRTGPDPERFPG